jgi:hypothetical protein
MCLVSLKTEKGEFAGDIFRVVLLLGIKAITATDKNNRMVMSETEKNLNFAFA